MFPGIVALHGFTGGPGSFDRLRNHLECRGVVRWYCPSLLGHGNTPPLGPRHFMGEVDRLAQDIAAEGMSGAHLLGYSLGARMALGLLARHPQLFASVTLVSVHPGLRTVAQRLRRQAADERWCQLLSQSMTTFVEQWSQQPMFRSQEGLSGQALATQKKIRRDHQAAGLISSLRTVGLGQMPDLWSIAATWPRSLQLVVGERDTKFSQLAENFLALRTRDKSNSATPLRKFSDCGHNVVLEAPEQLAHVLGRQT